PCRLPLEPSAPRTRRRGRRNIIRSFPSEERFQPPDAYIGGRFTFQSSDNICCLHPTARFCQDMAKPETRIEQLWSVLCKTPVESLCIRPDPGDLEDPARRRQMLWSCRL